LYCIGNADAQPQADPIPPGPKEDPVTDQKPAQLQVVPYDVLLAPGAKHAFKVRMYNAKGQLVKGVGAAAMFTLDGPGAISPDGTYTAPADNAHQCALVTCKHGDLTGTARVRITPPLPWKWDFNADQNVPLTWIGGRVRYEVRDVDGEKIIVKKSLLPTPRDPNNKLGTRSMMFMGPVDLANYTIQGDIKLPEVNGKISDVGLINSGYFMTIRGESGKLRIDSWPSHDFRTHQMIDADIQPGTWYTMKLTVVPEGSTAVVRGKLWKRGESEPSDWTVEMVDQAPNLSGSPGLYGHASDAEIYLDNLQVTPN
jgi:hypothetical protein